MMKFLLVFGLLLYFLQSSAQTFYYGNDLSYVNEMEDCGAVFKENMETKDVYRIFADHGTNLVKVRLWNNPSWQNGLVQPAGVSSQYSDFEDVKETIRRSKEACMQVMLDVPLSDFWSDPGKQLIPAAWVGIAGNPDILADSVYNYVTGILTELNGDSLMPEIVKIGNESNGGILRHTTLNADYTVSGSISTSWSRHAKLFNSAIMAVRDISLNTNIKPSIALHYAGLSGISNWYQNIINNGVTDFDIIGFSYYYAWHDASIAALGNTVRTLKTNFPGKEVMVVETGYLWSTSNFDELGNIITVPDPDYLPVIPEKQLEYMLDYTREVKRSGGNGVIFWEPAWVSTPCSTPWGKGSSQEHVAFFDPANKNFLENGGGSWTEPEFYTDINARKVTFKVDMTGQDITNGVFINGSWMSDTIASLPMANLGNGIYSYFTYLPEGDTGGFFFIKGPDNAGKEILSQDCDLWNGTDRKYIIPANDVTFLFSWESCERLGPVNPDVTFEVSMKGSGMELS